MREAVSNAVKHSNCLRVGVYLERDGEVRGLVEDDGEGFDPEAVSEEVLGVVRETMQPEHASLWLRSHRTDAKEDVLS